MTQLFHQKPPQWGLSSTPLHDSYQPATVWAVLQSFQTLLPAYIFHSNKVNRVNELHLPIWWWPYCLVDVWFVWAHWTLPPHTARTRDTLQWQNALQNLEKKTSSTDRKKWNDVSTYDEHQYVAFQRNGLSCSNRLPKSFNGNYDALTNWMSKEVAIPRHQSESCDNWGGQGECCRYRLSPANRVHCRRRKNHVCPWCVWASTTFLAQPKVVRYLRQLSQTLGSKTFPSQSGWMKVAPFLFPFQTLSRHGHIRLTTTV